MVVQLDKVLYGCVEAAALWYSALRSKLEKTGFVATPHDACVLTFSAKLQTHVGLKFLREVLIRYHRS
jgi:hypothetical protein